MHPFVYYEKIQHGTRELPAEYYYVDKHHPRYVMSAHWHTEWELIRIKEGYFNILLDEEEICAKEGDILDLAADVDIVNKSGAWYAYEGNKIGQGRENAKIFLKDNPDICAVVDQKVRAHYNLEGSPSEMDTKKDKKKKKP